MTRVLLVALSVGLINCVQKSATTGVEGDQAHSGMTMPPAGKDMGAALDMAAQHAMAASGPAENAPIRVKKAEGTDGHTVAELYVQRQALNDKVIAVRGQVVKYTPGILKRNWIHLRDGTGNVTDRSHDLTVTTQAEAAVGDVVLVHGTVHLNRDIGAGYNYPVIVEDATLAK